MALVLKDRVRESSTSSGTGSITLAGAYTGYQTFASAVTSGSTVYYTIHNTTSPFDNEWEVGVGTFTAPSTLSRDTVLSSSNSGNLVAFHGSSILEVFITQPAEQAVYINDATGKVEVFGNGTNVVAFTEINTTNLTANTVTLTAGTISTNASNATDITNKQYVDNLFSTGITYHAPVLVETPTALTATYNQPGGAGNGVGATLTNSGANVALTIDGVSLSNTARVLVYQQANAVQNGIYTVTNPGAPDPGGAKWVLTRATDADTYGVGDPNKLGQGDAFFVTSGNTGAGETYILNTVGAITFGTTNLTFAQISSAQIYNAGTGLNLANLTFSIANTAVTAATYGNDGNVAQITVNAQGQLTNAANVAINASSITVGTLANARTTASDANGASTIVARDSTGSFTANTITATTSNATTFNGTTGAFTNVSGNGSAISAINASNISSGTIANARTTGSTSNSASTLVLRDANGNFGSNVISASSFSGDGTAITAINASNISSGTIANARTTAASANGASTIVQRDSGGNFSANTVTAAVIGDLSGGTNINASNISSGTIANARTTASSSNGASTIVLRGASGEFAAGAITATSLSGNGSAITAINASAITTGTIDNARTTAASANGASTIVARDAGGNFSANTITATTFSGAFSGNGATISAINASNISSGTIANARTTAATANGASTIVLRGTSGEFSAGIITADGSGISAINASNISSGTIANARTTASSSNGASTIVSRDANGSFAAGTITAADIVDSSLTANRVTYAGTSGNLTDSANMVFATQYNTGANPALYSLYGVAVGTGTLSYPSTNTGIGFYSRGGTSMGGFLVQDGNGRLNQYWNAYTDAGIKYIVSGEASARYLMSVNGTTGGVHAWYGAPSGTAGAAISFTQMGQMTSGTGGSVWFSQRGTSSDFFIDTAGNIGMGTTSPSFRLQLGTNTATSTATPETLSLGGTFSSSAGANAKLRIWTDGSNVMGLGVSSNQLDYIASSGYAHVWYANAAERMRLASDGNLTVNGNVLTVGNTTSSNIVMVDTDEGNRTIHCNSNRIGFLTQAGAWGSYCNDDGSWSSDIAMYSPWIQAQLYSYGSAGNWNTDFQNTTAYTTKYNGDIAGGTNNPGGTWWFQQNYRHSNASNFWGVQVAWGWEDNANRLATRNVSGGSYGAWVYYLNSANFTTYAPSLTGSGASGTWNINVTGSAGSATTATNLSGGTVSATTVQASGGFTATSAAPFFLNATTVSANYTIPSNFNAVTAGTITINSGITVTVSTGSSWVIV